MYKSRKKALSEPETLWNSRKMESRQAWTDRGAHSLKHMRRASLCKEVGGGDWLQECSQLRVNRTSGYPEQQGDLGNRETEQLRSYV